VWGVPSIRMPGKHPVAAEQPKACVLRKRLLRKPFDAMCSRASFLTVTNDRATNVLQQSEVSNFMMNEPISVCIGCGCDDLHACHDPVAQCGCSWLRVDRRVGAGVCSCCSEKLAGWDSDDRATLILRSLAVRAAQLTPLEFDLASAQLFSRLSELNQFSEYRELDVETGVSP